MGKYGRTPLVIYFDRTDRISLDLAVYIGICIKEKLIGIVRFQVFYIDLPGNGFKCHRLAER